MFQAKIIDISRKALTIRALFARIFVFDFAPRVPCRSPAAGRGLAEGSVTMESLGMLWIQKMAGIVRRLLVFEAGWHPPFFV
jgi:hypothetical protein